jgi:hypothetical protein
MEQSPANPVIKREKGKPRPKITYRSEARNAFFRGPLKGVVPGAKFSDMRRAFSPGR